MKYKVSFIIALCLSTSYMKANPFSDNVANIKALAYNGKLLATGKKSATDLVKKGSFKNALYLRMLLSEFYCARCAIGVSPFHASALAAETDGGNIPMPKTLAQPPTPGLRPGGFNLNQILTWKNKAISSAADLKIARELFDPTQEVTSINPLDSFAGIIITLTPQFAKELGRVQIGPHTVLQEPMFFPYQKKKSSLHSTKNATSGISTVALSLAKTSPVSSTGTKIKNSNAINIKLSGSMQPGSSDNAKIYTNQVLIDMTLTNYNSTLTDGSKPLPCYLQTIKINIGDTSSVINVFDKFKTPTALQQQLINFFKKNPYNPWAFVVVLDGKLNSKKTAPIITSTIPAIVQLNPYTFWKYTQLESKKKINLKGLLDAPSSLYYSIKNTAVGSRNATASLLRGIANGYLTTWSYDPIVPNGNTNAWNSVRKAVFFPTPTEAFKTFGNAKGLRTPYTMLYALYAAKAEIMNMYVNANNIPNIVSIIAKPSKSQKSYINTIISKIGGIPKKIIPIKIPKVTPRKLIPSKRLTAIPAKVTPGKKPTVTPGKLIPGKRLTAIPAKVTPGKKPTVTPGKLIPSKRPKVTPATTQNPQAAIQAYKKGYKAGKATQAYKQGYKDGQKQSSQNSQQRFGQNRRNQNRSFYGSINKSLLKIKSLFSKQVTI